MDAFLLTRKRLRRIHSFVGAVERADRTRYGQDLTIGARYGQDTDKEEMGKWVNIETIRVISHEMNDE